MGRAKQIQQRRKESRKDDAWKADQWRVYGRSVHDDEIDFNESTEEAAVVAAGKINKRGGSVTVTRCVYNGPAALWLPEDHWRIKNAR